MKVKAGFWVAEFLTLDEGLCVQIMHHGPFDVEPATIAIMKKYIEENGYAFDLSEKRLHHEIYLSDPRKCSQDKNRCVIRYPVKPIAISLENIQKK